MRTVLRYKYVSLWIASPGYVAAKSAGICQVGEWVEGVPAGRDSVGEVKVPGTVRGLPVAQFLSHDNSGSPVVK